MLSPRSLGLQPSGEYVREYRSPQSGLADFHQGPARCPVMGKVFVTRAMPGNAVETLRQAGHDVEVWPDELPPPPDALSAKLAGANAALTTVVDRISPAMLDGAQDLKIVANMAVGYDNIDPAEAARRGIHVTNTPGVLAETTADMAWALLMAAASVARVSSWERPVFSTMLFTERSSMSVST